MTPQTFDAWPLVAKVDAAADLLATPGEQATTQASSILTEVHADLSELVVGEAVLRSTEASWLLALRDELSVHLSAAAALTGLDLRSRASVILRRAVLCLRRGISQGPPTSSAPAAPVVLR